jgi:hypothetical protein
VVGAYACAQVVLAMSVVAAGAYWARETIAPYVKPLVAKIYPDDKQRESSLALNEAMQQQLVHQRTQMEQVSIQLSDISCDTFVTRIQPV